MSRQLFLFAPGAGAPSTSHWMRAWKERLETLGDVALLDYPYMIERRRAPDRLPVLIDAHRRALHAAQGARETKPEKVVLAGKSMGSRVGCHLSLEEKVDGLVCFGYPLRGTGPRGQLRDEVLKGLTTPILFVQGTRDPLCPLDILDRVRKEMAAPNELLVVDGGDHSLEVRKTELRARGETQADVDARILSAVDTFTLSLPRN